MPHSERTIKRSRRGDQKVEESSEQGRIAVYPRTSSRCRQSSGAVRADGRYEHEQGNRGARSHRPGKPGGKRDFFKRLKENLANDDPKLQGSTGRSEEHTSELQSPCNLV